MNYESYYQNTFDAFFESVIEIFEDEFYDKNEKWIEEEKGVFEKWVTKLFESDKDPVQSATIIARAKSIFIRD